LTIILSPRAQLVMRQKQIQGRVVAVGNTSVLGSSTSYQTLLNEYYHSLKHKKEYGHTYDCCNMNITVKGGQLNCHSSQQCVRYVLT
jgi:hypothetical protein